MTKKRKTALTDLEMHELCRAKGGRVREHILLEKTKTNILENTKIPVKARDYGYSVNDVIFVSALLSKKEISERFKTKYLNDTRIK